MDLELWHVKMTPTSSTIWSNAFLGSSNIRLFLIESVVLLCSFERFTAFYFTISMWQNHKDARVIVKHVMNLSLCDSLSTNLKIDKRHKS